MSEIHAKQLTLFERIRVRFGKCPTCGAKLQDAILDDIVESWEYQMPKYTARTLDVRTAPRAHNTELHESKYCLHCRVWYQGHWSYRTDD